MPTIGPGIAVGPGITISSIGVVDVDVLVIGGGGAGGHLGGSGGGGNGLTADGNLQGSSGAGGSDVVIIKYSNIFTISNAGGGLTFTTDSSSVPGYKITTFTAGTGVVSFA